LGPLPELDLAAESAGAAAMVKLAQMGAVSAAIDVSGGGLMRAVCRMAFALYESANKMPSVSLDALGELTAAYGNSDTVLLGESAHCYVVAVTPGDEQRLLTQASDNFPMTKIGRLDPTGGAVKIGAVSVELNILYKSWSTGLTKFFR
jgi:phosphoribosylformylglycinamidine (FGAM) synthase-like enzyme